MPTAAERQALAFLAGVALLGGGVRVWQQRGHRAEQAAVRALEPEGVQRQLEAVSAARSARRAKGKGGRGGASGAPTTSRTKQRPQADARTLVVDVDVAAADELELLPRVGPALAARIVADRDSLGPFGSLEELGRVRGIGPAMLRLLDSVVIFSGRARARSAEPAAGKRRRYSQGGRKL